MPWTFSEKYVYRDSAGAPVRFDNLHENLVASGSGDDVFVLEGGSNSVAHIDSAGHFVNQFGKKGRGPGELGFPLSLAMRWDTVEVLDVAKSALVRWTTGGDLVPESDVFSKDGVYLGTARGVRVDR